MNRLLTARFEIRADARDPAERALHDLASRVRAKGPETMFTAWREAGATRYLALIREDEADDLAKVLAPYIAGELTLTRHELVTSTDLGRRHRPRAR
jgi:hypothetical protein